jgi:hypothetical protein
MSDPGYKPATFADLSAKLAEAINKSFHDALHASVGGFSSGKLIVISTPKRRSGGFNYGWDPNLSINDWVRGVMSPSWPSAGWQATKQFSRHERGILMSLVDNDRKGALEALWRMGGTAALLSAFAEHLRLATVLEAQRRREAMRTRWRHDQARHGRRPSTWR